MGGEGWGAKGMLAPLSNYWGRGYPPPPPIPMPVKREAKTKEAELQLPASVSI